MPADTQTWFDFKVQDLITCMSKVQVVACIKS